MPGLGPVTARRFPCLRCLFVTVPQCGFPGGFENDILIKSIKAMRNTTKSGIEFSARAAVADISFIFRFHLRKKRLQIKQLFGSLTAL